MNTTNLYLFLLTLRVFLDDMGEVQQYSDTVLMQGVQSVFQMNKLPGYMLTAPGATTCTPDILAPGTNPNNFAQVVYETLRIFIMSMPESYSYRSRAFSEKFGSPKNFLLSIETDLYKIKNGSRFGSWQSYHSWVAGMAGLPVGLILTNVNVNAPFFTANVSTAGVTITPSQPPT
jgi:hypothetical protein